MKFRLDGEVYQLRRFLSLAVLLFISVPFGLTVAGCGHKSAPAVFCNGSESGPVVGQLFSLSLPLSLSIQGESLNYGQIGQFLSATGQDCKGGTVNATNIVYATSDTISGPTSQASSFADINPKTGQVCGGTWNRNTGGGIADYTFCTPPAVSSRSQYIAYVTATSDGITSNAIPVYVHPAISSITFGTGASCSTDPDTTCCPASPTTIVTAPTYDGTSCVSQNKVVQIAARVISTDAVTAYNINSAAIASGSTTFAVNGNAVPPANRVVTLSGFTTAMLPNPDPTKPPIVVSLTALNGQSVTVTSNQTSTQPYSFTIASNFGQAAGPYSPVSGTTGIGTATSTSNVTCNAGHLNFGSQGASNIVTLDQNGVATALQPGSVNITAELSNSSNASSIGFFSTCPPKTIELSPVGQTGSNINVPLNNTQPFNTIITDTAGQPITGLALEFESTTPQTLPAGAGSTTPIFPGTGTITAVCPPPSCNPAPFSQLGYLGNGKPVTSNGVTITTAGSSTTALYVASTQSQYVYPIDFSTGLAGTLVKLPYPPNSMVITQDGSTIYFGSQQGLMTMATGSNTVSGASQTIQGTVLSVSPDGTTLVIADATRGVTSLVTSGALVSSYGAVGTHAQWTPDSQTVYITTTGNTLLTHSVYTNWESTALQDPASPSADTKYADVAVMVPSIGAYFAGSPQTDGRSYCSLTTQPATPPVPPTETNFFTPLADHKAVVTDRIAATADGKHILGASIATGISDLYLNSQVATNQPDGPGSCPTIPNGSAAAFTSTPNTVAFAGVTPTTITGVEPDSNSALAFVTFMGTSNGKIPYYLTNATSAAGTAGYFTFTNTGTAVTAPVSGVWSTDNLTFYVGTAGDNKVHLLNVTYPSGGGTPVITDGSQLTPGLPDVTGTTTVAPDLIAQRPRRVTS
jgi:hypothetical protein